MIIFHDGFVTRHTFETTELGCNKHTFFFLVQKFHVSRIRGSFRTVDLIKLSERTLKFITTWFRPSRIGGQFWEKLTEKFAIWQQNCSLLRCLLSYQMIQRDLSDILAQINQPSNAKPCNFDLVSKWLLQHSSILLQCCIRGVTSGFVDPVQVGYVIFFKILQSFTHLDPSPYNAPGPPCRQPCGCGYV